MKHLDLSKRKINNYLLVFETTEATFFRSHASKKMCIFEKNMNFQEKWTFHPNLG